MKIGFPTILRNPDERVLAVPDSYLGDGRLEIDNNIAERSVRDIAVGKKNFLFAGSDRGGETAAVIYTLVETAKLNGIDPQAWLTHVIQNIADYPNKKIDDLLPWNFSGV